MFETTSGLGHMRRSAGIANALARAGVEVRVASGTFVDRGSFFHPAVRFINLPEHRVLNKKKNLWYHYDAKGQKIEDQGFDEKAWQRQRDDVILAALQEKPAHAVIVEFWPFSRRREFSSTIDRISRLSQGKLGRPLIFSSSRDILETANSMEKSEGQILKEGRKTVELIQKYVDRVFIHGDRHVARLEQEFPFWKQISTKTEYTGYVVESSARPHPQQKRYKVVVVSVGSGSAGLGLIQAAARARPLTTLRKLNWLFILGPRMQKEDRDKARSCVEQVMQANARLVGKTEIYDHRPDLPQLLKTSEFSISLGGYNTTLEMLLSEVPGVLVPKFVERKGRNPWTDMEQKLRLIRLAKKNFVHMAYPNTACKAESFSGLINRAVRERNARSRLDMNGAEKTARQVQHYIEQRFRLSKAGR
jgi:predicted glycosyltransferase